MSARWPRGLVLVAQLHNLILQLVVEYLQCLPMIFPMTVKSRLVLLGRATQFTSQLSPGALGCLIQLGSVLIQLDAGMLDAFVMLYAVMLYAGMLGFMMLDS